MKIIKSISDDEMVLEFLRAEINSDRFSPHVLNALAVLNLDKNIILNPNTKNQTENIYRKKILTLYRGYQNNSALFENFPNDVKWFSAILNKNEFLKIQYLNWDYWLEISENTRSPSYVVQRIKSEELPEDKEINRFKQIANIVKSGDKLPKLILISQNKTSKLVVLEGHARLTAYSLASECLPSENEVIVGFSENFSQYDNY